MSFLILQIGPKGRVIVSEKFVLPMENDVGNGSQDSSHTGTEPIDKVMCGIVGVFEFGANTENVPSGSKHRIHCGTASGEEFNEDTNGHGGHGLFDKLIQCTVIAH